MKIRISVLGCCLIDHLYSPVSFNSKTFIKYQAHKSGDGGMEPGKLVFVDKLEQFSGKKIQTLLSEIVSSTSKKSVNIGGPGIVAAICAAQVAQDAGQISFYGGIGSDKTGQLLLSKLSAFPLDVKNLKEHMGETACTYVLSDPNYQYGYGERAFLFKIGVLKDFKNSDISDSFFYGDIALFGATAVMPKIHGALDQLLQRAKREGMLTIVSTVYDFIQEQKNHNSKWEIGSNEKTYSFIDLLICDQEEALRMSGEADIEASLQYFKKQQVKACIITRGKDDVLSYAQSKPFKKMKKSAYPVSRKIDEEITNGKANTGDTTGCGDNFAGGVLASIAMQMNANRDTSIDLQEAIYWGIAAGGSACFYMGGSYKEKYLNEKREIVENYYYHYRLQQNDALMD